MNNRTCVPCAFGQHDSCQVGQPPPEGALGGWQCDCDHDLADDFARSRERFSVRVEGDLDEYKRGLIDDKQLQRALDQSTTRFLAEVRGVEPNPRRDSDGWAGI